MFATETPNAIAIQKLRHFFESGATRSIHFRKQQLNNLEKLFLENYSAILEALAKDLGKPQVESIVSEIAVTLDELRLARKKISHWMKPKKVATPLPLMPAKSRIYPEPLGVVLIFSAWNYPIQLLFSPLIGAIASGNCVVLKPSELAPYTAKLIHRLVEKYFSSDYIKVIEGGVPESAELLREKFDSIFFTGSTRTGKIIYEAAAKNLTPVVLELGGKSPAIITKNADLDIAARRLVLGKFFNAGQTCVAPDYLYLESSIAEKFLEKLRSQIKVQFGARVIESKDYARIINAQHFQRLQRMLPSQQNIFCGGEVSEQDLYIAPTILYPTTWESPAMQEEIFGPILPILTFENLHDTYQEIRAREKPLAAYFFSQKKKEQDQFLQEISFGGGVINDVLVHLSNPYLPFGGVGASGIGAYHGEKSFLNFSHSKSILFRYSALDIPARYAPYSARKKKFLEKLFRL